VFDIATTEIRLHGRAGQGIVTAAELLASAAGMDGKYSQAFPLFGSEKRGPPVSAFARISDSPIRGYEPVYEPDVALVADSSVLVSGKAGAGLKPGGLIITNYPGPAGDLAFLNAKVCAVDGTKIALEILKRPIFNTVMLGALLKITNVVSLGSLNSAIRKEFPGDVGEKNVGLVKACYDATGAKQ
jgi:pyruvate ferredoxin oxidoreductase gamma subunit